MDRLIDVHRSESRIVAGVMTGTSLDGGDAVIVRLGGSGPSMEMDVLAFVHHPYPDALRSMVRRVASAEDVAVNDLTRLNVRLASFYAGVVGAALDEAGLDRGDLDLVGSHGQTIRHLPEPSACAGEEVRATLQIGDPSTLAQHLGTVTVGNFRAADVAVGGQGAPLVPYFDYVTFTDPDETRALVNLGGIANVTLLPAGGAPGDVRAFDTGPANMVVDALAARLYDADYDDGGRHAAAGTPDHDLLADLLQDDFFRQPPPKSTGRETFGDDYVDGILGEARARNLSPDDVMATATLLTAASIYKAYAQHLRSASPIDVLIASGGGVHNDAMMEMLADAFAPIPVRTVSDYGIDGDAKEALCFAVLAHETLNGVPTNLPSVTGADRPALLGSISVPR
jgi:anhydro-N-acetylmuramic acid kinase